MSSASMNIATYSQVDLLTIHGPVDSCSNAVAATAAAGDHATSFSASSVDSSTSSTHSPLSSSSKTNSIHSRLPPKKRSSHGTSSQHYLDDTDHEEDESDSSDDDDFISTNGAADDHVADPPEQEPILRHSMDYSISSQPLVTFSSTSSSIRENTPLELINHEEEYLPGTATTYTGATATSRRSKRCGTAPGSRKVKSSSDSSSKKTTICKKKHRKTTYTKKQQKNSKTGRWTVEECKAFLIGLKKHGKGKWSKIAKDIPTRDTVQVKTHAQGMLKKLQNGEDIFELLRKDDPSFMKQKDKDEQLSQAYDDATVIDRDDEEEEEAYDIANTYLHSYVTTTAEETASMKDYNQSSHAWIKVSPFTFSHGPTFTHQHMPSSACSTSTSTTNFFLPQTPVSTLDAYHDSSKINKNSHSNIHRKQSSKNYTNNNNLFNNDILISSAAKILVEMSSPPAAMMAAGGDYNNGYRHHQASRIFSPAGGQFSSTSGGTSSSTPHYYHSTQSPSARIVSL